MVLEILISTNYKELSFHPNSLVVKSVQELSKSLKTPKSLKPPKMFKAKKSKNVTCEQATVVYNLKKSESL